MSFLDNLPKIPFLPTKREQVENFFALNIDYDKVTAAVWTVYQNQLHVLNTALAEYNNEDEFDSEHSINSLIEAANYSLDEALADIMPEPTKLLFGVPDSWLENENIKPDYLKILKRMVKELGVEPMAYVSATHAIAHVLQKQQGVPLSAVLVNVSNPVVVTVMKGGKPLATKIQPRGKSLATDVEKGLAALTEIEVFPSRILVYGLDDVVANAVANAKDDLAAHPWMEQLPFLHLPRVEELPTETALQAVCFAGASELNPNLSAEIMTAVGQTMVQPRLSHDLPMEAEAEDATAAGFVAGDINQRTSEAASQRIGDEDYVEMPPEDEEFLEQEEWVEGEPRGLTRPEDFPEQQSSGLMGIISGILAAPLALIRRSGGELEQTAAKGGMMAVITSRLVLIPVIVLVVLVLMFYFLPQAQVSVFVDMKPLDNSAQIIADPTISSIDEANNKIPGKIIETDVSGSGTTQATGQKQVGDPAKGKVVIYNATTSNLSLSQGTTLSTSDGKKFTLDTSVQVASKSASAADPPTHSDPVGATASQIGPDGNIAAGTDLTIGNYSQADVDAKVDTAFSGGVSKNVQVVTAADQQKLLAQVTNDLKAKAQNDLQGKLTGDQKIQQESFIETITKKTYDKNVGDEASSFNLTVTAHYKGTAYSDGDLKTLVAKLVQTQVLDPDHYTLDMNQTETQAEITDVSKDGKLTFNAQFKAKLMPKLDTTKLRDLIVGKSVAESEQILKDSESQIIGEQIKLTPSLPGPFQRLPLRKENISIVVTAK